MLDLGRRQSPSVTRVRRADHEVLRNVMPIPSSILEGVARHQPIAVQIQELASKGTDSTFP
jgi:hypothetical protein